MQCMSPPATLQEPHCDLLWTNDSAKCLVCRSPRIKLDSRCQIIQLCVTLLQFSQYYFRDVRLYFVLFFFFFVVFFFFFPFSIGRKMFCNGIFNVATTLTCKLTFTSAFFYVRLVRCNQRNNKIV